jgi:ABC-2 type transport system permease protein
MVRVLLSMVRKDLLRQLRSPLAMGAVLAFPLVFAALIGLVFGGGGRPRVHLLVEDRDGSLVSGLLVTALSSEQAAEHFEVERVGAEGVARMELGEASALLRLPPGFGAAFLAGKPVTLELVRNPAQGILPEIAEQSMTVVAEVLSAGSSVLREPLAEIAQAIESEGRGFSAERTATLAAAIHRALEASGDLLFPPVITLETVQLGAPDAGGPRLTAATIFAYVLPGISVWALFLTGDLAMRDIVTEASAGTLRRQLCSPLRPWQVVIGKAIYTVVLAGSSLLLLTLIGGVALRRAVSVPGYAVLSLALLVAITGYASAIYGALRTQRQAATLSAILMLIFAFTGGSFFDVDQLPEGMRRIAPLSPFYWGTTGYRALIRDDAGLAAVWPNAAVLAGAGLLLLAAGCRLLDRRVRRAGAA